MSENTHQAVDGVAVWELLTTQGGLDVGRYDAALAEAVATRLEVDVADLPGVLADRSAEEVVRAFLVEAEPFVMMWTDLLRLFERAGATSGASSLQISYTFDEDQPDLTFDIEHFRRDLEVARQAVARHWFTDDNIQDVWRIWRLLKDISSTVGDAASDRDGRESSIESWRSGAWPEALPERPTFDGSAPRFESVLNEIWDLATRFLIGLQNVSTGYEDLVEVASRSVDPTAFDDVVVGGVLQVQSDFWLPQVLDAAVAAAEQWDRSRGQDALDELDTALTPFRHADAYMESTTALESFLALPLWKFRHELYSNWVATQVIDALDDRDPRIHSADGVLDFKFSGTHLATFDGFKPSIQLWTEFRSPLRDPIGKGRVASVQPDMELRLQEPSPDPVPLVVECKHYLKADNKEFADAISDYGRAHPDARVTLVDHGPVREETVLSHVDERVVDRASVIAELRPDRPAPLKQFRQSVRGGVAHVAVRSWTSSGRVDPLTGETSIVLRWTAPPLDLDIWVDLSDEDHITRVDYQNPGRSEVPPFCTLDRDVRDGSGPETVTIHRLLPVRYDVYVDVFNQDVPAPGSTVTIANVSSEFVLMWPPSLDGGRWAVCSIDGSTGQIIAGTHQGRPRVGADGELRK